MAVKRQSWVTVATPPPGYIIAAEWRRGERPPTAGQCLHAIKKVRRQFDEALAASDDGSVQGFWLTVTDTLGVRRQMSAFAMDDPMWLPDCAFPITQ